jgi:caffeoyl-CoA O-methyltransferase
MQRSPTEKSFAAVVDEQMWQYLEDTFAPEDELLSSIRRSAAQHGLPPIHVGPFDGRHLEVLVRAIAPKRVVEVGTLAGYSAICLAKGLAPGGRLWTLELSDVNANLAKSHIAKAGFSQVVEVLVGPALKSLDKIQALGPFDLVFIDADKENYPNYVLWAEKNLRVGGVLLADNTLAWNHIHEENIADPVLAKQVEALRECNKMLAQSKSWRATMLPTGEGLTMAVKIG